MCSLAHHGKELRGLNYLEAVFEKAQRGDTAAFEDIVELHEKLVYSIAFRMLGSREDAADVTQDSFIRLFKNIRSLEDAGHLKGWLCRVAHNICVDELRKRKIRPTESLDAAHEFDDGSIASRQMEDSEPGPEDVALMREDIRQLERAIAKLPDEYRVMIVMRDLGGLSYQEIADATQLEMGTVKSRLSRSRARLKELYLREQSELRIVR